MSDSTREQTINNFIQQDAFAKYLNAEIEIVAPGHSRVSITVTEEMANFQGFTHGGLIFALGDMAFAAASNSHGQTAVALNVNINFLRPSSPGDQLLAEAKENHSGGRIAIYEICVYNAATNKVIAKSENVVYRKNHWFAPQED